MKITDTTKNPHREWLMGGNPAAIETQEADGQRELCESSQLPKLSQDYDPEDQKTIYKSLGIKVLDEQSDDPLFYDVILPGGWKIKSTEHSIWSDLYNDKNEIIGSIFYKAAFYDRRASFNLKG